MRIYETIFQRLIAQIVHDLIIFLLLLLFITINYFRASEGHGYMFQTKWSVPE